MRAWFTGRRMRLIVSSTAILAVSGGVGMATGAIPGIGGRIDACVAPKSGLVRIADGGKCRNKEKALSWNEAGPQGPQGEKGAAGDRGAAGAAGPAGDKGPVGLAGAKGDKGDAGPAGSAGGKGDAGPAGAKGDVGPDGAAGPKGDQGDPGPQGDKGDPGATGPAGPAGDDGAKGDTGATGPQGDKGDKGDTGPAGAQGDHGPQGPMGPAGATGPQGPIGPAGAQDAWTSWISNFTAPQPLSSGATQLRTLALPIGSYILTASVTLRQGVGVVPPVNGAPVDCFFGGTGTGTHVVQAGEAQTFTHNGFITLGAPSQVALSCRRLSNTAVDSLAATFIAQKVVLR